MTAPNPAQPQPLAHPAVLIRHPSTAGEYISGLGRCLGADCHATAAQISAAACSPSSTPAYPGPVALLISLMGHSPSRFSNLATLTATCQLLASCMLQPAACYIIHVALRPTLCPAALPLPICPSRPFRAVATAHQPGGATRCPSSYLPATACPAAAHRPHRTALLCFSVPLTPQRPCPLTLGWARLGWAGCFDRGEPRELVVAAVGCHGTKSDLFKAWQPGQSTW